MSESVKDDLPVSLWKRFKAAMVSLDIAMEYLSINESDYMRDELSYLRKRVAVLESLLDELESKVADILYTTENAKS